MKFLAIILILSIFGLSISDAKPQRQRSLAISQSSADSLFRIGYEQYHLRQFYSALQSWQQARALYQEIENYHAEGTTLSMITIAYIGLGRYSEAVSISAQALQLANQVQDTALQIQILGNLGISYASLGQYIESIDTYEQAIARIELLPENSGSQQKAGLLGLLGNAYSYIGEYEQAIEKHDESLQIAENVGDQATEITALGNLGAVYAKISKYNLALEHYSSSLQLSRVSDDLEGTAYALNNIGSIFQIQNKLYQALEYYLESLTIAQTEKHLNLEVDILSNLGSSYESLQNYEEAISYYEQSLLKAETLRNPQAIATALNNLGHGLLSSGRLNEAEVRLRTAIDHLESLRPTLNDAYNISLFDTQIFTYSLLQQILMAQDEPEAALEIAERGRAQAFVDLLAQRTTPERIDNISNLERQPLAIEEIKTIAREQDATLVEYALIPDDDFKFQGRIRGPSAELFIWVVKPTGEVIFHHEDLTNSLPENTTLKELISFTREGVGARGAGNTEQAENCHSPSGLCLGDRVVRTDDNVDRAQYEISAIDQAGMVTLSLPGFTLPEPVSVESVQKAEDAETWHDRLNQLHRVLIAPIKDDLPKNPEDRVIFVPQEELFLVPFPALRDQSDEYLIEDHTISTIPSIQVLANTRRRRLELADSTGNALIVGNPSPMPSLKSESSDLEQLPELPNSEIEANNIAQILNTDALVNTAATESAVKQQLSSAKIIHLASHGLFQEKGDPLQSRIALASTTEEQDGFLTAEEILDYDLQADLVVLSACDTGRGSITGDGVIGLSRSFLAAGTPSVMVSLWQVPDAATSELMIQFYQNRQTLDKAQSLRQAMLHMIEREHEPKDWAAFTLIGEAE